MIRRWLAERRVLRASEDVLREATVLTLAASTAWLVAEVTVLREATEALREARP